MHAALTSQFSLPYLSHTYSYILALGTNERSSPAIPGGAYDPSIESARPTVAHLSSFVAFCTFIK